MTRVFREASEVASVEVLDHVIVWDERADPPKIGFYSFRAADLL